MINLQVPAVKILNRHCKEIIVKLHSSKYLSTTAELAFDLTQLPKKKRNLFEKDVVVLTATNISYREVYSSTAQRAAQQGSRIDSYYQRGKKKI